MVPRSRRSAQVDNSPESDWLAFGEQVGRSGVRALQVATLVPAGWVGAGLSEKACNEVRAAQPVVIDVEFRGLDASGRAASRRVKGWHQE